MKRFSLRIFLSVFGGLTSFQCPLLFAQHSAMPGTPQSLPAPGAAGPTTPGLNIVVIAGNNAVNIVKDAATSIVTVEIRDMDNHPVAGAVVNFASPDSGPSVLFPNGARAFSVVAEANGRATVQEGEPIATGPFTVTVAAEFQGRVATAQIRQENYLTYADAERAHREVASLAAHQAPRHKLSNRAIAVIVIGVAAATAAGVAVGLRGGGSSSSQASGLGAGTPTVGAPH